MAQQPLQGRGLSQTILQPTDILGEAQARQQQEQVLAARQQAAQKPPKAYEYEGIERYGDLYSNAYKTIDDQIRNFATKHAYELDPDSEMYDPKLRARFDTAVRNSNEAASLMSKNSENFYKDYEELDPSQRSNTGAMGLMGQVADLGKNFKIDFETGLVGIEDEDGKFMTFDEVDYITNPREYYYTPKDWSDIIIDQVKPVYADIERGDRTIKEGDIQKIEGQLDRFYNLDSKGKDFQYSTVIDYLKTMGVNEPDAGIVRSIVEEGEYTTPDGAITVTKDEALDWGKQYTMDIIKNQLGYTEREGGDGGGLEFNFGDARKKLGGSIGKRDKKYFEGFDFYDPSNPDAPLEWDVKEYDVYTPKPGTIKIDIPMTFPDDDNFSVETLAESKVRDIIRLDDDVLAVTFKYAPTRGVYRQKVEYIREGDPIYESLKSAMNYDPIQFMEEWKRSQSGDTEQRTGELD